ncbi:MAG: FAD-binding oxidoreductase [Deltaproteobacteria bacterium]|nr:FAD-binding oxidoreductase [Deltaproteobacteria bacterium]
MDPQKLDELSWDALSMGRLHPEHQPEPAAPICAAVPASTEEVRRIVAFANAEKLPLVPYGGGSGLMGGALSIRPCIVVDLRGMNRILEIDIEARSARIQSGIVLQAIDERLQEHGFILGHDPWTVPVATVGGAISTNSVGYRAGVYGSMGEQVLGLEAVLPNGEIIRTRAVEKSSAGIDLNALFIGGEGCFGIVTEATIRIFPRPEARKISALLFPSFAAGYRAVQELFTRCLAPALLDLGDAHSKYPEGAVLYLAFEGNSAITVQESKLAISICVRHGASRLPEAEAQRFWRDRHVIAQRFMNNRTQRRNRGRDGIFRDWVHVALPASEVLPFRESALDIVRKWGVSLQESGLWIQPELYSLRLGIEDNGSGTARQALQDAVAELVRMVQQLGGSMEYTHGVGIKLAPFMAEEHGYGLEVLRQIKKTLDPNNIMNPGKMGL